MGAKLLLQTIIVSSGASFILRGNKLTEEQRQIALNELNSCTLCCCCRRLC